ncbi:hypothetical protein K0651_03425 [Ornithinimicrobium sp. Arc0846-15]|nr:hypothetical protein [Ornithinimicrobium laminariae]
MDTLANVWPYVAALIPTAGLLFLFWVIMKHILEGDRRERAAQREWENSRAAAAEEGVQEPQNDTPQ